MTTAAAKTAPATTARTRTLTDRYLAAFPLVTIYLWLLVLYGWQARRHPTPWVFIDEIKFTRIARGIADHLHPVVMGQRTGIGSFVTLLMAPAWLLSSVGDGYAVAKWIGVVCMTATIFPAYWLARMVVGRAAALFAATGAVVAPALGYSLFLVEEPYAYPFATLCFFLMVKALVTRSRWWIAGAVVASVLAPGVRSQLMVVPAAFALCGAVLLWQSDRVARWRGTWSRWDWVGFAVLLVGCSVVFNAVMGNLDSTWLHSTGTHKKWVFLYGIDSFGTLAMGLAVFPVVAGLMALAPGRGRLERIEERMFALVTAAATLGLVYYAGIKGAYIRETFSNTIVERNVIYLTPLVFAAAAMFCERPAWRPRLLLGTLVVGTVLFLHIPTLVTQHYYYDAPGEQVLQWLNRAIGLTPGAARLVLLGLLLLSCEVVLLVRTARPWIARAAAISFAVFTLAWCLTGEINFTQSVVTYSRALAHNMSTPRDWVDRASHGKPVIFLGANLNSAAAQDTLYEAEFWNRSIVGQWTIDGATISPTNTPNIDGLGRLLYTNDANDYYLTTPDVDLDGTLVEGPDASTASDVVQPATSYYNLWKVNHPLRLAHVTRGLTADGWASSAQGGPATVSYSQFVTPGYRDGYLAVELSRRGTCGKFPVEHATIRVGRLKVTDAATPAIGKILAVRHVRLDPCLDTTVTITGPHAQPLEAGRHHPLQAEVTISPTFQPHAIDPRSSDQRWLGAQVGFDFIGIDAAD